MFSLVARAHRRRLHDMFAREDEGENDGRGRSKAILPHGAG
jgi:hypothetical protein